MEYEIQKPLKELKSILSEARYGSPRTRNSYETVVKGIIKDLYFLKLFFNTITSINVDYVNQLINQWKRKKLSNATIGSRLSILRQYLALANHIIALPSNYELGLAKVRSKQSYSLASEDVLTKVHHPITKLILKLQIYFGLTKSEALDFKIQIYTYETKTLFVHKSVSHNGKDRMIEMRTAAQENVIHDLSEALGYKLSLSDKFNKTDLLHLYHSELMLINLLPNTSYRSLYARSLYQFLINNNKLTRKEAIKKIVFDMGMSESRTIIDWIGHE